MTNLSLPDRERALVENLTGLIADRARAVAAADADAKARTEAAYRTFGEARQKVEAHFGAARSAADKEHETARAAALRRFETEHAATADEYERVKDAAIHRAEDVARDAQKTHDESRWTLTTLFDAKERDVKGPLEQVQAQVANAMQRLETVRTTAESLIRRWRQQSLERRPGVPPKHNRHSDEPAQNLKVCLKDADNMLADLQALRLPRLFQGYWAVLIPVLLGGLFFGTLPLLSNADGLIAGKYPWMIVAPVATLVLSGLIVGGLYIQARIAVTTIYRPLRAAVGDGEATCQRYTHQATKSYQQRLAELGEEKKRLESDVKQVEEKYLRLISESRLREKRELHEADQKYPARLTALEQRRDAEVKQAEDKYRQTIADIDQKRTAASRRAEELYQQHTEGARRNQKAAHAAAAKTWQDGLTVGLREAAAIRDGCFQLFPAWDAPAWEEWAPPTAPPPVVPFGEYRVPMTTLAEAAEVPGPLPEGAPEAFTLPALLSFPRRCSLLLRARDAGRAVAVQTLQTLMLRFLTSLPPGKARFSIIDPVGLGENFSAFMHLADYDEALVSRRIWTEPQQIEQVLADTAAHMENVIQKYLRNQYASIEEYNAQAGEVAEPFRVVVVANFPSNFTVDAARRLVSIAASGASCGVFVLVSVDTRLPMPHGFNLADLEQSALCLAWKDDQFVAKDPVWSRFPLRLESAPGTEFFTRVLHAIGTKARDANRVEVPFDYIAPAPNEYWTGDSRGGINVPLGRSGATKRQSLMLGKGTAQHALVAGKTGSGKSTLLHALITNLALNYSPAEVELYLIDFKKGVEFKAYAAHHLPHARVIAIESEREFGLSVLQRLDAELRERGDRFRNANVQNLADYRNTTGNRCPRMLLIVDEFQEFFVEDDKVAQEASLLLDRLVRQGRAFGLHVLLGSQTLGGAYTLARSTIDQMAVRIALQCSEADAQLILSKDNAAARLLSRPGEAIYNDANGLLEGNDIFQTVWLSDERREELLGRIAEMAVEQHLVPEVPALIFEGNIPADTAHHARLEQMLREPAWPTAVRASVAWLGEPMAIKEPTAALFRRQASSNLLLIGQREEAALAVLAANLVSLAAQHAPPDGGVGTQFYVLDGSSTDSPNADFWPRMIEIVPHPVKVATWRDLASILGELGAEVDRRVQANDTEGPALFLIVYGLQRFRDLRRADDDFGFGRRDPDQPIPPAKRFETLLREGPAVGVHALVWGDTLTNVQRAFDRQAMRDFEMRVLFPMSANDSSTLIDSPAASRLNVNHALYCTEDRAQPEKFRPFGLPSAAWLAEVKRLLGARTVPEKAGV
jgi:hypothetical protein